MYTVNFYNNTKTTKAYRNDGLFLSFIFYTAANTEISIFTFLGKTAT